MASIDSDDSLQTLREGTSCLKQGLLRNSDAFFDKAYFQFLTDFGAVQNKPLSHENHIHKNLRD